MRAGILESLQETLGSVTEPFQLEELKTYTCLRDILNEVECAPEISSDPKCDSQNRGRVQTSKATESLNFFLAGT